MPPGMPDENPTNEPHGPEHLRCIRSAIPIITRVLKHFLLEGHYDMSRPSLEHMASQLQPGHDTRGVPRGPPADAVPAHPRPVAPFSHITEFLTVLAPHPKESRLHRTRFPGTGPKKCDRGPLPGLLRR